MRISAATKAADQSAYPHGLISDFLFAFPKTKPTATILLFMYFLNEILKFSAAVYVKRM